MGVQTTVPDLGGLTVEAARSQLEALGFGVTVSGYVDSSYAVDAVAYTYPAAGETLASGDTVAIYQSDGSPPRKQRDKGRGGGGGGGTAAAAAATATAVAAGATADPDPADPRGRYAQPSWRRTSAATADPSARPLTWGWTTPITLPIARIPSPAAPVCSMAAETIATTSASESGSGR